ncbi:calcineurin-like phosphoesterase family protein 9 [Deinococcus proteolyticus MRP]|uniref:Calcineurin-like phosphoesterase family protein 9 n=1 Tax=Deinococcus proteolyticus (strain ATCC 35074 / DSM 20540 / JCM 6276 / NBRC 101906 / NCIMB 13154 / VKM Ac-1939 / CCM 2703 / MRP) TaxID=693977 RepID=F0RL89_DEIPM|nr:metallophosphoesterase [Deinococcus proteolyticus]ADY26881.1 calcineurin-like phosphoesterase family protein 9 [Deinococcus proteolyticus MRP]
MNKRGWRQVGWVVACGAALAACGAAVPPKGQLAAQSVQPESSFMLMALPDTQYYSAYWPEHFKRQTGWLAAHAGELNVKLTTHLGDIVDMPLMPYQWDRADQAMRQLENAGVPYSVLPGNHDILLSVADDRHRVPGGEEYLRRFSPARAAQGSTFGGRDATGWNEYHTFTAAGQEFLVLALNWRASAQTLDWARQVMREHPSSPTILTTHDLVGYRSGELGLTSNGEYLWKNLIEQSNQIFLTLNGHDYNSEVRGARISRLNAAGQGVDMVLVDYQNGYQGGQGYLRGMEFDLARGRIEMMTFSPSLAAGVGHKPGRPNPAELAQEHSHFFLNVNFRERFAAFAPDFPTFAAPREVSLTDRVRQTLR